MRSRRPGPALVLSCLALLLAAGGAAFGAAKAITSVQIVDPATPSQIAKVDAGGHLLTSVNGAVNAKPAPPGNAFATTHLVPNNGGAPVALVGPSSTAIDLTALLVTPPAAISGSLYSQVELVKWDVPSGAPDCQTNPSSPEGIWLFELQASEPELGLSFPTPLVARPPSGRKECLAATTAGFDLFMNVSGYFS